MASDHSPLLNPVLRIGPSPISSFTACGIFGLFVAVALTQTLVAVLGLRPEILVAVTVTGVAVFYTLALVVKWVTGIEKLIYYHHELAIVAAVWLLLTSIGVPAWRYLDILQLGIAAFLASGRIGCLLVGCCHGRPSRFGVRYGTEHAREGFPATLVGVRLLPVQAIESILVAALTIAGTAVLLHDPPPGTVVMGFLTCYGLLRFGLEELRGDTPRATFLGVSHNQWTAVAVAIVLTAVPGPWRPARLAAAALLIGSAVLLINLHRRRRRHFARMLTAQPSFDRRSDGRRIDGGLRSLWSTSVTPEL